MSTSSTSAQVRQRHDLPAEIHASLVTSLYADTRTLLIGSLGSVGAATISAWKTSELLILLCAVAMAAVTVTRLADARAFARERDSALTPAALHRWELRYVVDASAYVALMGAWCLLAFTRTSDAAVQLLSFSMILVNMIGIAGRNFGSARLVNAQLVCAGVPMTLALLLMGDVYYAIFACVLVPFFISMKTIADRLRKTLLDAAISAQDVSLLARRFDTALNNMPLGLCMFD